MKRRLLCFVQICLMLPVRVFAGMYDSAKSWLSVAGSSLIHGKLALPLFASTSHKFRTMIRPTLSYPILFMLIASAVIFYTDGFANTLTLNDVPAGTWVTSSGLTFNVTESGTVDNISYNVGSVPGHCVNANNENWDQSTTISFTASE